MLKILAVQRSSPPDRRLHRFVFDLPAVGPASGFLRMAGWILPKVAPVSILVFCQGSLLCTLSTDRPRPDVAAHFPGASPHCGFDASISAAALPPAFDLSVMARLPGGEQIPMARIQGTHGIVPRVEPDRLQPLLLTSLGRTGTTLLMRLLADHPAIVAERVYPYEAHAALYWMHLGRALANPRAAGGHPPDWGDWNDPPAAPVPATEFPLLRDFAQGEFVQRASDFACDSIERYYRIVAGAQQQTAPRYFCEKFLPTGIQHLFLNRYAGCREIFLVRDFRDVLCSVFAFNARRGTVEFGRERVASDADYVADLGREAHRLLSNARSRPLGLLVRYEDLILRPRETLGRIFAHLDLPAPPDLEGILHRASTADPQHRTAATAVASIGRWKTDLSPALTRLAHHTFNDMLRQFGYDMARDGSLMLPKPELN